MWSWFTLCIENYLSSSYYSPILELLIESMTRNRRAISFFVISSTMVQKQRLPFLFWCAYLCSVRHAFQWCFTRSSYKESSFHITFSLQWFETWRWCLIYDAGITVTSFELAAVCILLRCSLWCWELVYSLKFNFLKYKLGCKYRLRYFGAERVQIMSSMEYTTASERDD